MNTKTTGEIRPKTTSNQDSATETANGVIRPSFGHRINIDLSSQDFDQKDLIMGLEEIVNRATGVLSVFQSYLLDTDSDNLIKPDLLYFGLDSVRNDLLDIKVVSAALLAGGVA